DAPVAVDRVKTLADAVQNRREPGFRAKRGDLLGDEGFQFGSQHESLVGIFDTLQAWDRASKRAGPALSCGMITLSRRRFIAAGAALAVPRPAAGAVRGPTETALVLNDASRLNPVPVARNAVLRADSDAAADGRPVCVGGARHSMGGQSLVRNGFAASIAAPVVEPDTARRTYRVRAGARWRDVIAALDPLGFSPMVTQSNHDFSVGGTLCVNAHGWPVPYGPFGATLRSFRAMLADGTVMTCSRNENAELFGLALGGYGLFGIVIDAELETAD